MNQECYEPDCVDPPIVRRIWSNGRFGYCRECWLQLVSQCGNLDNTMDWLTNEGFVRYDGGDIMETLA